MQSHKNSRERLGIKQDRLARIERGVADRGPNFDPACPWHMGLCIMKEGLDG